MQKNNEKFKKDFNNRVYKFALEIIYLVDNLDTRNSSRILGNQFIRSATSIGANIIEAKSSSSKKDYINYFTISLKSANETKFWLNLIRDSKKVSNVIIEKLLIENNEIANIIASSVITLKKNPI